MNVQGSRRKFLGLLGAAGAAGAALPAGAGAQREERPKEGRRKRRTFQGTSKKGSLQEALDLAVQAALRAAPGADRRVEWALKEVTGRQGGFGPANEVTVVIEAGTA